MKFKGANDLTVSNGEGHEPWEQNINKNYLANYSYSSYTKINAVLNRLTIYTHLMYLFDYNYFATSVYESIKDLSAGTDHYLNIKFGDWFLYYEYDEENKTYDIKPVALSATSKIVEYAESYWCIKVSIFDTGLTKAEQSLFNSVKGSTTFNMSNDYTDDTYFIGRTIIDVDETMFTFVHIVDNKYALKLKQDFIDYYSKYYDLIELSINIDFDYLEENDIYILGYADDSGLDNFTVHDSNIDTYIGGDV